MDRLIRECQSIVELNRIIDRGLDDETYQLAMDRLFELVLEGERDVETTAPANDANFVVSPENTAVTGNAASTSNDGYNRERNGPENNQEMDETLPSMSTGATSFVDVINSMEDIDGLNRIIDEDNWTTEASGVAFQRILQLAGVEYFDEMIRNWSNTVNEEMQEESTARLDDLMEVIDDDNMAGGDNPIDLDQNVPTPSEGERKRPSDEPVDELRNRKSEEALEDGDREELRGNNLQERTNRDDVSTYYEFESTSSKHVKKFKTTATEYRLRLKNLDDTFALDGLSLLSAIIDDVLERLKSGIRPRDMVKIVLNAPGLDHPLALPFIKKDDLTIDRFIARVEHVLQSNKDVKLDSDMTINFVHMDMPEGGKSKRSVFKTWEEKKKEWNSIIDITNQNDDMCLARAIITGQAKQEFKSTDWVWRSIRDGKRHQKKRAKKLHKKAGVPRDVCGLDQVKIFQEVIPDYQLCVVSKEHLNKIIYKGPDKPKGIYLLYNDHHFDVITSMSGYLNTGYWCHPCKKGYNNKEEHRCENTCRVCRNGNCSITDGEDTWTYCDDCNRYFKSLACYNNHKIDGSSVKKYGTICKQYYKCALCDRVVDKKFLRKGKKHACTDLWCRICKGNFPAGHKCYIKPAQVERHDGDCDGDSDESFCYIFFDVEARQETGIHKPTLCVAQKSCHPCAQHPWEEPCDVCAEEKQKIFEGEDCMTEFCLWLFKEERHRRAIYFAHNLKGYDGYFILQFLYDNAVKPDVVMNGVKIMSIYVPGMRITFKDSLNCFPMALSKLPKAFGVQELCKGHFPHLFHKEKNAKYEGSLPEAKWYDADGMSASGKKEFEKWYVAEKEKVGEKWNLREQLLKYCINDVDILRKCCMQFRTLFMEVTKTNEEDPGVDPLKEPITIAAACNLVLCRNFLEPDSIAIIPPDGYGPGQNFSRDSIRWLNYEALKDDIVISHAMNGGEVRLQGRVTVDGICFETRKIYSYLGCLFHGCKTCYDEDTINPISQKPMAELYRLTQYRKRQLQTLYPDYEIVEMWEHDWRRKWHDLSEDVKERIEVTDRYEPLNPANRCTEEERRRRGSSTKSTGMEKSSAI